MKHQYVFNVYVVCHELDDDIIDLSGLFTSRDVAQAELEEMKKFTNVELFICKRPVYAGIVEN